MPPHRARRGVSLAHGRAHDDDHRRWSRRGFLSSLGALSAGAFMMGASPVRVYGASPFVTGIDEAAADRILVLIQLRGGNDGLNTVVPYNDDIYYNLRPSIAISKAEASALDLTGDLGLHPALAPLHAHFGEGRMAVVQNVGYPDTTLSHFRSTDIWLSASDADQIEGTGWLGRHLQTENPGYLTDPPPQPLAVQLGGSVAQLFKGPTADMGMMLTSNRVLEQLIANGELYSTAGVPATTYGDEMAYVRRVANSSFRYADAVAAAYDAGSNSVAYPDVEGRLADNLATISRLIRGGLGARIYHVTLIGFDTHDNQPNQHANLLDILGRSVDAFLRDIADMGDACDILTMTYSEFGRRVTQNGSRGTDHGTAAPILFFGNSLNGGVFGGVPDLVNLDGGNLPHTIDFRSVYGTVLEQYFGIGRGAVREALLGFDYETLGMLGPSQGVGIAGEEPPRGFALAQNYPNPFRGTTRLAFHLQRPGQVMLEVFDLQGRRVATLTDGMRPAGAHTVTFDAQHLPSGTYLYRLQADGETQTRQMTLLR